MTKNRTEVADIDRSLYDFTYGEEGFERLDAGITPDIVREISAKKDEPQWMLDLPFCRSLCFALHYSMEVRLPFGRKNIRNFFEKKNRPLKNQRTTIHIRCSP